MEGARKMKSKIDIIEQQNQIIEAYRTSNAEIFKGWDNTLNRWKRWSNIWVIQSILVYIAGILLGMAIGGAW